MTYCPKCREEAEYFTVSVQRHIERDTVAFGVLSFDYTEKYVSCKKCKERLYSPEAEKENNKEFQNAVKKAQQDNVGFDYTKLIKS